MKIPYENWRPGRKARGILDHAEQICQDYASQGYDLTLRQLYYQFVAAGLIPNTERAYKGLGEIINRGRRAGYLDWDHIVDRTRNLVALPHWETPADIIDGAAKQYRVDKWADQSKRIEVWVEKEALSGVIEQVANRHDVAWFACRGYVSQSELWGAAKRLLTYDEAGQDVLILHLGDHDPSGIDMTRDIRDRLKLFAADGFVEVRRIALNMEQVEQYRPPPNPAKITDTRARDYIAKYGRESWELDALDPAKLDKLIERHILAERDKERWNTAKDAESEHRELLAAASDRWEELTDVLKEGNHDQ